LDKKRPNRKQLLEAGKIASDLLEDRKIILPKEKSAIDTIQGSKNSPVLPGIPSYLPHAWVLNAARRVMRDLLIEWKEISKGDIKRLGNSVEFFKFVVKRMREEENETGGEIFKMAKMVKKLKDMKGIYSLKETFQPVKKMEAIKGLSKFFIDSFAVSIVLRGCTDTPEYVDWFYDWTDSLLKQWDKNTRKVDG
jgi:hypothetical protein